MNEQKTYKNDGIVREREREKDSGKVGRIYGDGCKDQMPKDITDRERSQSAGKSNSVGSKAGPRTTKRS